MTPKWQRPVEVRMKKHTDCQNHSAWTKTSALLGGPGDGGRKSLWSIFKHISFSCRSVKYPKTTCWENRFLLHMLSWWCAYRTIHNDCGMHWLSASARQSDDPPAKRRSSSIILDIPVSSCMKITFTAFPNLCCHDNSKAIFGSGWSTFSRCNREG